MPENLRQETKLDKQLSYQYDKTDQIKEGPYNEGKRKVNYQWDQVGNRTQVTYTDLAQPVPIRPTP